MMIGSCTEPCSIPISPAIFSRPHPSSRPRRWLPEFPPRHNLAGIQVYQAIAAMEEYRMLMYVSDANPLSPEGVAAFPAA